MAGCRNRFLTVLIVSLITYNVLIYASMPLGLDFPSYSSSNEDRPIGLAIRMPCEVRDGGGEKRRQFHTVVTASGSVYNTCQCRVVYYWYKEAPEVEQKLMMGGFTRRLHSGKPNPYMDEVPTFIA